MFAFASASLVWAGFISTPQRAEGTIMAMSRDTEREREREWEREVQTDWDKNRNREEERLLAWVSGLCDAEGRKEAREEGGALSSISTAVSALVKYGKTKNIDLFTILLHKRPRNVWFH